MEELSKGDRADTVGISDRVEAEVLRKTKDSDEQQTDGIQENKK